jgi:PAS domain S-box-containing protein
MSDNATAPASRLEGDRLTRALVESSDDAMFAAAPDGTVATWNPGAARLFGYDPAEIVGRPAVLLWPSPDPDDPGSALRRALAGDRAGPIATAGRRKDGAPVAVSLTASPIRDASGRVIAASLIAREDRDEAIAGHRDMERRLLLLAEASSGLSARLDQASVLAAVLALSRRLVSADAYAAWRFHPESRAWSLEVVDGLSAEYRETAGKVVGDPPPPGSVFLAEDVSAHPLLASRLDFLGREGVRSLMSVPLPVRGETAGTLTFYYKAPHRFDEIETRIASALASLAGSVIGTAELYERLREADGRKEELLAMLAHELRNPVSAIAGAVRLGGRGEDAGWAWEVIERQAKKLGRILEDLLDASRFARGEVRLRPEPIDARRPLADALDAVRPLAAARGHQLVASGGRGPIPLVADPVRLEQILTCLLTNASQYTPPGGRIEAGVAAEGPEVVFRVRDDGRGIAPERLSSIFALFAQGERSLARTEGGLGVGLTLVRRLAELHGGRVEAESDGPGAGSLFTVRLPAPGPAPTPEPDDEARPGPRPEGSRILVIDPDVDAARGLARLLGLLGHEVETAFDGPAGLEAARRLRPRAVLMETGLRGISGYELAARLRREEFGKDALVIAVSTDGRDEDRRLALEAGFDHLLVKPLDHAALMSLLAR